MVMIQMHKGHGKKIASLVWAYAKEITKECHMINGYRVLRLLGLIFARNINFAAMFSCKIQNSL